MYLDTQGLALSAKPQDVSNERRRKMGKLSNNLNELGFFSALGTSEECAVTTEEKEARVGRGDPHTYDYNNGVMVIYDEQGRPWIIRSDYDEEVKEKIETLVSEHRMKRGAYVPHSNDGGKFVRKILPKL